jgi:hypothetical protein
MSIGIATSTMGYRKKNRNLEVNWKAAESPMIKMLRIETIVACKTGEAVRPLRIFTRGETLSQSGEGTSCRRPQIRSVALTISGSIRGIRLLPYGCFFWISVQFRNLMNHRNCPSG